MADYERLRGFVAQSMGGPKLAGYEVPSYSTSGTYTFTAPVAGTYKFVLWGGGGGQIPPATEGCGSGGYCEYTRFLPARARVTVVVGVGDSSNSGTGGTSSLTFPDGKVVTATGGGRGAGGVGGAGGVASGGDVNLNGSVGGDGVASAPGAGLGTAGGAAGANGSGGAGAPANAPYTGAPGGTFLASSNSTGLGPGAGGAAHSSAGGTTGGTGLVIVQCLRPQL